jgi:hypothetical protein
MATDFITARSSELSWRQIEDEVVVLDSRTNLYLSLNGAGALLWQRLVEGAAMPELVGLLQATYGIDEGRATADVDAFVTQLADQGLLQP